MPVKVSALYECRKGELKLVRWLYEYYWLTKRTSAGTAKPW